MNVENILPAPGTGGGIVLIRTQVPIRIASAFAHRIDRDGAQEKDLLSYRVEQIHAVGKSLQIRRIAIRHRVRHDLPLSAAVL